MVWIGLTYSYALPAGARGRGGLVRCLIWLPLAPLMWFYAPYRAGRAVAGWGPLESCIAAAIAGYVTVLYMAGMTVVWAGTAAESSSFGVVYGALVLAMWSLMPLSALIAATWSRAG